MSEYSNYLEVAIEAAREAGGILLAELDHPPTISYKGEVDIVTQADGRSEAAVVARLRNHFPRHAIIGEEGGAQSTAASPAGEAAGGLCWYIDPLDGTTNFAHGYPCFAVSIALWDGAEPLVGVVHNPVSRELFHAARGDGAYLNGKRIRVSRVPKLAASLLCTGFPTHLRAQNPNINYYWRFTLASHGVRRDGAASLDLCALACGRFDGFWEFGLKPWDTAAGLLMVREAGGMVSDLEGRPYRLGGASILASNGLVHDEMRELAADIAAQIARAAP